MYLLKREREIYTPPAVLAACCPCFAALRRLSSRGHVQTVHAPFLRWGATCDARQAPPRVGLDGSGGSFEGLPDSALSASCVALVVCVFQGATNRGKHTRPRKVSPLPAAFPHFGAFLPAALRSAMPRWRTPTANEGRTSQRPRSRVHSRAALLGGPACSVILLSRCSPCAVALLGALSS